MTKEAIYNFISQADAGDINDLLTALQRRYKALFPNWEICFYSLPNDNPNERAQAVEEMVQFIRKYGQSPTR